MSIFCSSNLSVCGAIESRIQPNFSASSFPRQINEIATRLSISNRIFLPAPPSPSSIFQCGIPKVPSAGNICRFTKADFYLIPYSFIFLAITFSRARNRRKTFVFHRCHPLDVFEKMPRNIRSIPEQIHLP